jgi:hypothetical protein
MTLRLTALCSMTDHHSGSVGRMHIRKAKDWPQVVLGTRRAQGPHGRAHRGSGLAVPDMVSIGVQRPVDGILSTPGIASLYSGVTNKRHLPSESWSGVRPDRRAGALPYSEPWGDTRGASNLSSGPAMPTSMVRFGVDSAARPGWAGSYTGDEYRLCECVAS